MGNKQENREKGKAYLKFIVATAVVAAAAILGAYVYLSGPGADSKGNEAGTTHQAPPPREVAVVKVQPETVMLTTELPGRVSASLVAQVRPQASGIIEERLFSEGSYVKAGQTLYRIDSASFQAAVRSAEANLSATYENLKRARAALETSIAQVSQQEAVLTLARTNRDRLEGLAREGAATEMERDKAVTEAQVAEATLKSAKSQVKSNEGSVDLAKANIKQAEAALEAARISLAHTSIKAPISGRIGRSSVTVGALVTAHQPLLLATIQKFDPVFVDVSQSTAELLELRERLKVGQVVAESADRSKVQLILENGSRYDHQGTLQFRDVTVDPTTGSVNLRIIFPNPDEVLLPGMYVKAIVTEGKTEGAILIPQRSVSRDPKGNPLTMVVDAEGKIVQKMLSLDRAIGDRWLVSQGLEPGERVVVEGKQWVRPGSPVTAVPYKKEETGVPQTGDASKTDTQPE